MVRNNSTHSMLAVKPPGTRSRGRRALHRTRSPLTRKIVAFNLVGLSLLVAGILFLSQSRENLIELRTQTLEADALVLAAAVSNQMKVTGETDVSQPALYTVLESLSENLNARSQLFSADGILITDNVGVFTKNSEEEIFQPPRTDTISDMINDAWVRLESVFARQPAASDETYLLEFRSAIARRSVLARDSTIATSMNDVQQLIVTIAVPINLNDEMVGAIVLSTLGGEIDGFIRDERQQILEMFVLAAFTSIFLSIILANTIGRPLRELAQAAEKGSAKKGGKYNPGRVDIPDLSSRPDEIGDLSRQLRNMTSALYDRIEANEAFAADVAHEIKNPLTSLGSAVETMRYVKDDAARERLLNVIRDDVNRMDRLVTDISNASRLDAELAIDEMETVDLTKMLDGLVDYQKEMATEKGVTLSVKLPENSIKIIGLESRLAQVFVNLITNAISFVPEGGSVTVIIDETKEGDARIRIDDTGCGIPEDNLKDVFKRFYSNRPEQDFGNNSGLGLSISKQIVEAHGGKIWAENIIDPDDNDSTPAGARFTVTLPE